MFTTIFWTILRSIAVPYVAFLILRDTPLGLEGTVLAIAIALSIVTIISLLFSAIKIFGNAILLRGEAVLSLIIKTAIQVGAVLFIWGYYLSEFSDVMN
jgi:hypothetical protein